MNFLGGLSGQRTSRTDVSYFATEEAVSQKGGVLRRYTEAFGLRRRPADDSGPGVSGRF